MDRGASPHHSQDRPPGDNRPAVRAAVGSEAELLSRRPPGRGAVNQSPAVSRTVEIEISEEHLFPPITPRELAVADQRAGRVTPGGTTAGAAIPATSGPLAPLALAGAASASDEPARPQSGRPTDDHGYKTLYLSSVPPCGVFRRPLTMAPRVSRPRRSHSRQPGHRRVRGTRAGPSGGDPPASSAPALASALVAGEAR